MFSNNKLQIITLTD